MTFTTTQDLAAVTRRRRAAADKLDAITQEQFAAIRRARIQGMSLRVIAAATDLSFARIHQIEQDGAK